jgi:hypothetical protein
VNQQLRWMGKKDQGQAEKERKCGLVTAILAKHLKE